jgi:hypothetical protein
VCVSSDSLVIANLPPRYAHTIVPVFTSTELHWWGQFTSTEGYSFKDSINWKRDLEATAFIQELLSATVKRVPFSVVGLNDDGIEEKMEEHLDVIEMKTKLQSDERSTSSTLVLPPGTRGAWRALRMAIKRDQSDQRFLVVGSAGVGKSRSINHLIREYINEAQQSPVDQPLPVVVFEHRKDRCAWLFAPKDPANHQSDYEAFKVPIEDFVATKVAALNNPNTLYVVDSGMAENSKGPALLRAVTVYVCSPDRRHFSEFLKHTQAGGTFFIPWWQPEAMEAAQPYMLDQVQGVVELAIVRGRMAVVGPIPRRVFCVEATFNYFKTQINNAMQNTNKQEDIANVLKFGADGIEADKDEAKPLSAVFGFDVVPGSNYKDRTVRFVSDYARLQLSLGTLKSVYSAIITNIDPHHNAELGNLFEQIVYRLLQSGWNTTMTPVTDDNQKHTNLKLEVKAGNGPVQMIRPGPGLWQCGYDSMKDMPLVLSSGAASSEPAFFGANFPVIDAADACNRGFSVTIALTKTIKEATLQKLRASLDLEPTQLLHIVFLVPEGYNAPQIAQAPLNSAGVQWYKAVIPSPLTDPSEWERALGAV